VQLVSKISNLCAPDPPTLQTDGRTDDMQSQDHTLHYSVSCGKNVKTTKSQNMPRNRAFNRFNELD